MSTSLHQSAASRWVWLYDNTLFTWSSDWDVFSLDSHFRLAKVVLLLGFWAYLIDGTWPLTMPTDDLLLDFVLECMVYCADSRSRSGSLSRTDTPPQLNAGPSLAATTQLTGTLPVGVCTCVCVYVCACVCVHVHVCFNIASCLYCEYWSMAKL